MKNSLQNRFKNLYVMYNLQVIISSFKQHHISQHNYYPSFRYGFVQKVKENDFKFNLTICFSLIQADKLYYLFNCYFLASQQKNDSITN